MRILVFGDSITQGFHDTEQGGWCSRLINEVMRRDVESDYEYDRSVVNLGVSGDTTANILDRVKPETKARLSKFKTDAFDVLLLAVGVNDSQFLMDTHENMIPVEKTIENISEIVNSTSDLVSKVVLIGLTPVFDERVQPMAWKTTHGYSNEVIDNYNEEIKKFALENNLTFIDVSDVFGDNADEYLPDGIHPNAEGHRLIFERVKGVLEKEDIL